MNISEHSTADGIFFSNKVSGKIGFHRFHPIIFGDNGTVPTPVENLVYDNFSIFENMNYIHIVLLLVPYSIPFSLLFIPYHLSVQDLS